MQIHLHNGSVHVFKNIHDRALDTTKELYLSVYGKNLNSSTKEQYFGLKIIRNVCT